MSGEGTAATRGEEGPQLSLVREPRICLVRERRLRVVRAPVTTRGGRELRLRVVRSRSYAW